MGHRVEVVSGDGKTPLGQGNLFWSHAVYFWEGAEGQMVSYRNADRKPGFLRRVWQVVIGHPVIEMRNNPVIDLDNGQRVFGRQVWWVFVEEK